MNNFFKQGFSIGENLKKKGLKAKARRVLELALGDYATYENRLIGSLSLGEMVNIQIPFELIESENDRDMYLFLAGVLGSLNRSIDSVVTVKEASGMVGIDVSNINRAIISGRLVIGRDCRKSGGTWLIERDALIREFGLSPLTNEG